MKSAGGSALPVHVGPGSPDAPRAGIGGHGEPGALVVLEGIDRSGRSTHTRGLEERLRYLGRGVTRTSLGTAQLAGPAIRAARAARSVDARTMTILYAADIAERIEQVIAPALRAGLVVLADRYVYTPMARAAVRGIDEAWLGRLFSFAPPPRACHASTASAWGPIRRSSRSARRSPRRSPAARSRRYGPRAPTCRGCGRAGAAGPRDAGGRATRSSPGRRRWRWCC